MTSSHPANPACRSSNFQRSARGSRRAGFTLIELLVVIGIILILLGLLLPMLSRAVKNARKGRMQSDLHVIASALDAYRGDFKDYPRTDPSDAVWGGSNYQMHIRGACTLCWALLAPGNSANDGADGNGFRIRTNTGQVYGPYVSADAFKIGFLNGGTLGDNHYYFLADTNGYPYLYWPANKGATLTSAGGYIGSTSGGKTPMFDTDDNDIANPVPSSGPTANFTVGLFARGSDSNTGFTPVQRFEVMMGAGANGAVASGQSPKFTGPYLLWGLGPDDQGGPDDPTNSTSISQCDDVTNIP